MGKSSSGGSAPAADPNIGLAQQEMAKISREYLDQWKTEIWPEMKAAAQKQETRADEQFAIDKEIQTKQIAAADKTMAEFNRNAGNREAIYKEAENYNTAENKERIASEAIGDTKTAFGVQAADLERRNQSYGINPTSGRSIATQNANSVMQAATEGAAATRARNAAEQLGWAKKMDAAGLAQGQFGNQATSTGLALSSGAQGFGIGQQSFGNYGAMGNSMAQSTSTANQGWNSVGQLGVQKYQADVSRYNAEQQANATSSAGMGSAIGAIGGAALKYAPAMIAASDIRMKENIEVVGHLTNGLAIYEFEYKPEFKDNKYAGYGRFRGLMAHEVEAVNPEAVLETSDGYKAIDYSKVN